MSQNNETILKIPFALTPVTKYEKKQKLVTNHVLALPYRGYFKRFAVGVVVKGAEGRRDFGGPMVPGPWAYAFGLCTVIDNHGGTGAEAERNRAANTEHTINDGDLLELDGNVYKIRVVGREHLKLDLVGPAETDTHTSFLEALGAA